MATEVTVTATADMGDMVDIMEGIYINYIIVTLNYIANMS
jgi:hypothetical protein